MRSVVEIAEFVTEELTRMAAAPHLCPELHRRCPTLSCWIDRHSEPFWGHHSQPRRPPYLAEGTCSDMLLR